MATVKDIAKRAGVSPTTVSWALNGKPVSQDAYQRVMKAAEDLNYHRQRSARSLRAGKVFSIGFYIVNPSLDSRLNGYLFPMLAGMAKVLGEEDYSMQFDIITPETVPVFKRKVLERAVDGMLILPQFTGMSQQILRDIPDDFPLVFMQNDASMQQRHCVSVDHPLGAEVAIRYLYAMGHRKVAIITGMDTHLDSIERVAAFDRLSGEMELRTRADWVQNGMFDIEGGYAGMCNILKAEEPPTAVFCMNDYMAVGAIRAVRAHGLRVPEDISIVGFDNADIAEACVPRLTTIHQPVFEQGVSAAETLLAIVKGETVTQSTIRLKPTLVERESVTRLVPHP